MIDDMSSKSVVLAHAQYNTDSESKALILEYLKSSGLAE